jgi:hypothetical protein
LTDLKTTVRPQEDSEGHQKGICLQWHRSMFPPYLRLCARPIANKSRKVNDEKVGDVIQLQGDQRNNIRTFLTDKKSGLAIDSNSVQVHGF